MTNQHSFVFADHDRDGYTKSKTGERLLNAAIVQAKISESFDEYLEIFDTFYTDDVEVSIETENAPIRGKARARSFLYNFLLPLHVMAEVGGLSTSIRETPIPGDAPNQTHSAWTLDLVGASGAVCTVTWCTLRKWNGSRVAYERHYDHKQTGDPLTLNAFKFNSTQKGRL
jgi:hypothetical protein